MKTKFISHATFYFISKGNASILVDPFFAEGFQFDKYEKRLTGPEIRPKDIKKCDAIFISHIHGDHYDSEAVKEIVKRTKAKVFAPREVLEDLLKHRVPAKQLNPVGEGFSVKIKDVVLTTFAGYDNSFDAKKRENKYSVAIETNENKVFYSGDCHHVPPGINGKRFDAFIFWPHPKDNTIKAFYKKAKMGDFIMMHGDCFTPGEFICNFDHEKQRKRIMKLLPGVKVVVPKTVSKI